MAICRLEFPVSKGQLVSALPNLQSVVGIYRFAHAPPSLIQSVEERPPFNVHQADKTIGIWPTLYPLPCSHTPSCLKRPNGDLRRLCPLGQQPSDRRAGPYYGSTTYVRIRWPVGSSKPLPSSTERTNTISTRPRIALNVFSSTGSTLTSLGQRSPTAAPFAATTGVTIPHPHIVRASLFLKHVATQASERPV